MSSENLPKGNTSTGELPAVNNTITTTTTNENAPSLSTAEATTENTSTPSSSSTWAEGITANSAPTIVTAAPGLITRSDYPSLIRACVQNEMQTPLSSVNNQLRHFSSANAQQQEELDSRFGKLQLAADERHDRREAAQRKEHAEQIKVLRRDREQEREQERERTTALMDFIANQTAHNVERERSNAELKQENVELVHRVEKLMQSNAELSDRNNDSIVLLQQSKQSCEDLERQEGHNKESLRMIHNRLNNVDRLGNQVRSLQQTAHQDRVAIATIQRQQMTVTANTVLDLGRITQRQDNADEMFKLLRTHIDDRIKSVRDCASLTDQLTRQQQTQLLQLIHDLSRQINSFR